MKKTIISGVMLAAAFFVNAAEPFELVNENGYSYLKLTEDLTAIGFEITERGNPMTTIGGKIIDENGNSNDIGLLSNVDGIQSLSKNSSFQFYLNDIQTMDGYSYSIVKSEDGKYRLSFTSSSENAAGNANHGYSQGKHKGGGYGHNNGNGGNKGWGNGANIIDGYVDDLWVDFKIVAVPRVPDATTGMPLPGFAPVLMMTLIAGGALALKRRR